MTNPLELVNTKMTFAVLKRRGLWSEKVMKKTYITYTSKWKAVMRIVALALIALGVIAPIAAFAAPIPAAPPPPPEIKIRQVFITSVASADGTFTYVLKPLKADNPMPKGSAADGYMFEISGNAEKTLVMPEYNREGIYVYELRQLIEAKKQDYTYDEKVYIIEIYVSYVNLANSELEITVIVMNEDTTKVIDGNIGFVNRYSPPPVDPSTPTPPSPSTPTPPAPPTDDLTNIGGNGIPGFGPYPSDPLLMVDPPVKKTVSGNPDRDSAFKFKLEAGNASQPMPAGSVNGVKIIMIFGSGEGEFGTWSYDKEGVYYYKISEIDTGEPGYAFDTAIYTITDTVSEVNGQLVVSRVVTNIASKPVSSLSFINRYTRVLGIEGPKTGDDSNGALYAALLISGGVITIAAAIYLFAAGKRRRRSED
jgi:pilin isopeptide linkage protein